MSLPRTKEELMLINETLTKEYQECWNKYKEDKVKLDKAWQKTVQEYRDNFNTYYQGENVLIKEKNCMCTCLQCNRSFTAEIIDRESSNTWKLKKRNGEIIKLNQSRIWKIPDEKEKR